MGDADDRIKQEIARPRARPAISPRDCLSTGSTLLNLACTGRPDVGFPAGYYVYFVGDTESGKTFLCLTCLAEAALNRRFADYRFVYDGTEFGALMDMERFFGRAAIGRLEPPRRNEDGSPRPSWLIEEFYFNVHRLLNEGRPLIYILDSMDALTSRPETKKFDEHFRAADTGKKVRGDYGDGKAKLSSRYLRRTLGDLQDSGSLLIVINQTRDNPDAGPFQSSKTHSGGHALSFYSTLKLWSSVRGPIRRTVKGKERWIGNRVKIEVKKNRVTGRHHSVTVPIYPSVGIDDLGSCVDYLVAEGRWSRDKAGVIKAPDLGLVGRSEELIREIEGGGLESRLRRSVAGVWREIESRCGVERKPRY